MRPNTGIGQWVEPEQSSFWLPTQLFFSSLLFKSKRAALVTVFLWQATANQCKIAFFTSQPGVRTGNVWGAWCLWASGVDISCSKWNDTEVSTMNLTYCASPSSLCILVFAFVFPSFKFYYFVRLQSILNWSFAHDRLHSQSNFKMGAWLIIPETATIPGATWLS